VKRATRALPSVAQLRLVSQRIVGSSFTQPVEVVRWLLAAQAQDFAGAKWSLGLRATGLDDAAVDAALASRQIVRSWPMRGTLHFIAAEDLHWILALTTPRLVAGAAARRANLDLDDRTLEQARSLAIACLAGGHARPREQLLVEIERGGVSVAGQRGYHILWHLAQTGTLCFGPPRFKEHTFVLLDEWVTRPRRLERDEALGELARRYFTSHGPATVQDFSGWTKLVAADVKVALVLARAALAELIVDGVSYWMARDAPAWLQDARTDVGASAVLLPGFDEYLLGYQDRADVLAAEHRQAIVPGGNGVFKPTIVVGGRVVGTWTRLSRAKTTTVVLAPFEKLTSSATRMLRAAAQRYGQFVRAPSVELRVDQE